MKAVTALLEKLKSDSRFRLTTDSVGARNSIQFELPPDLEFFYSVAGPIAFDFGPKGGRWEIFGADDLMKSEHYYWGGEAGWADYISMGITKVECKQWLRLCQAEHGAGEIVSIDLDPTRFGRCTFATHEMHCYNYEDFVIANSFTEWLDRLLTTPGDQPYWEQPGFPRVSAYGS